MIKNILVVTACGNKKEAAPTKAWQLYKSPRIKAVYRRRLDCPMAILSAKHGLVDAHTMLAPYDQRIDESSVERLLQQVSNYLKNGSYEAVVYFKAGSREEYLHLITSATAQVGVPLASFGRNIMGDVNYLGEVIQMTKDGRFQAIETLCTSAIVRLPG